MSCCCFSTVSTSEVAVIERCGKFSRLAEAGLVLFIPCIDYVGGRVTLRVRELTCSLETKTKDNVFVVVHISVQYQAIREYIYNAFYILSDHEEQMKSYVFDVIRSALCGMTLDESFASKDEISHSLKAHLQEAMSTYGFSILNALVTDLSPDARVRDAMNEINASKRMKEAALQRAEGDKVLKVKRAEAEAESMYLSGVGVAKQRKAIMDGLRASILDFSSNVSGTTTRDVMDLLILNQYFDTLEEISTTPNSRVVFLNDGSQLRDGVLQAGAAR